MTDYRWAPLSHADLEQWAAHDAGQAGSGFAALSRMTSDLPTPSAEPEADDARVGADPVQE